MHTVLIPPPDRFDELATKVLDVLRHLSVRGATEFAAPDRGAWIFDFDGYRSDGRATAVQDLLKNFGEDICQATVHRLDILAGYVVLNAERYDSATASESNSEPEIKVRQLGAMLRHEFGG